MSPRRKLVVAAAACGACCAAPLLILPALTALGLSGAGLSLAAWAGWIDLALASAVAAIAGAAFLLWFRRRRASRKACIVPEDHPSRADRKASSA